MPALEIQPMKELFQNLLKLQELEFGETTQSSKEARISELRRKIPLPILEHYDRLVIRGKKGVAIVRNQVCGGCHMSIPIGSINTLMHGEDIQMCENCGRYLYLPPAAPVEAPEVEEETKAAKTKSKPKRRALVRAK
jgi:predicted  nucleic acid-binding Zn-ribbon protein